jgi:hypothetical protein
MTEETPKGAADPNLFISFVDLEAQLNTAKIEKFINRN